MEDHQHRPPAIECLLRHLALSRGTIHHRNHSIATIHHVERFFPADLLHRPGIRGITAITQSVL